MVSVRVLIPQARSPICLQMPA